MKVNNVTSSNQASSAKRKKKADGHGNEFAEHLKGAAQGSDSRPTGDVGSVSTTDGMLALQEVAAYNEDDVRRRKKARQYGDDLLDRLEELRRNLILGAIPKDRLAELARAMRTQKAKSQDPRLDEIINEIELRAEVEIAKLTRKGF